MNITTTFYSGGERVLKNVIIAVDVMGGDHAPYNVFEAISLSAIRHPYASFLLFGLQAIIEEGMKKNELSKNRYQIIHTDDVIVMDEKPSIAIRQNSLIAK